MPGGAVRAQAQRRQTGRPVLSRAEVERGAGAGRSSWSAPALRARDDEPVRLLATPIGFERHRLIVVVGASLAARDDALCRACRRCC